MRRFVTLAILLLFTIPFGVSISGCGHAVAVTYCNGQNTGVQVGQAVTLDLEPRLTGISINQGAIGSVGAPTAKDCKGNTATVTGIVYASTNRNIVDVNPATGSAGLCAGQWNRNTGGGIPDYTVCTPNGATGVVQLTASGSGVTSNAINVYVHPIVTSIVLGPASIDCANDPASNCYNLTTGLYSTTAPTALATSYNGAACVSQASHAQLAARIYAGTSTQSNISAFVGPITFSAQNTNVVTIDTNGVATATQPGSTIITAANSQSSSSAGYFSTCPPKTIVLSAQGSTTAPTAPIAVSQNVTQPLVATITDQNGVALTNISLEYVSTTPVTVPTSSNNITPAFPGAATITAVCQPPTCNYAPDNLIGAFGNGTPVLSNPVQINAAGTNNSTALYIASTNSQYILPLNFTVTTQASAVRLPYAPNSLVLSTDGTTIYMGTQNELMVFATGTNSLTKQDTNVSGYVLAVSPDNSTVVISDPVRKLTYLYASTGSVTTEYGGFGTNATFSPDSTTVYIPTDDGRMLVHSTFNGWTAVPLTTPASGVALTVPQAGVYLGSSPIDIHTNCPATQISGTGLNQVASNTFYPDYGPVAGANITNAPLATSGLITNDIASLNNGTDEIAATIAGTNGAAGLLDITTNQKSGACPFSFTSNIAANLPFTVAAPSAITSVLPTSDSAYSFVTYTGTGGVVPQFTTSTKSLSNITLQTTANGIPTAPVAGVVSSDNQTFYVGTAGDNLVHRLTRGASGFSDTQAPLIPALPNINGGATPATPNLLAQKPIKANS